MRSFRYLVFGLMLSSVGGHAASSGSGVGLQVGLGLPFVSQAGFHYKATDKFGFSLGYNLLDFSLGDSKTKLSMPEFLVHYHPFSGSFFVAAGVGQENLKVSATDITTGTEVAIEVAATTTVIKTGWMWGITNGGFWFGIDMSYVMPSGGTPTITAPGVPASSQSYIDAVEAADKFSKTAYTNFTFARLGWIF